MHVLWASVAPLLSYGFWFQKSPTCQCSVYTVRRPLPPRRQAHSWSMHQEPLQDNASMIIGIQWPGTQAPTPALHYPLMNSPDGLTTYTFQASFPSLGRHTASFPSLGRHTLVQTASLPIDPRPTHLSSLPVNHQDSIILGKKWKIPTCFPYSQANPQQAMGHGPRSLV